MGEIRVIGGQWRGRKLKVHDSEGLRPTTDRLKETLFNWLMMDIRASNVLDCFAGAGSLSFEAASRGAKTVTSIEKDKTAANQLKQNTAALAASSVNVINSDFFNAIGTLTGPLDIVFIDPPFHKGMINRTLSELLSSGLLSDDALIYIEQESNGAYDITTSEFSDIVTLKKEKKAGQVLAQLFEYKNA